MRKTFSNWLEVHHFYEPGGGREIRRETRVFGFVIWTHYSIYMDGVATDAKNLH